MEQKMILIDARDLDALAEFLDMVYDAIAPEPKLSVLAATIEDVAITVSRMAR